MNPIDASQVQIDYTLNQSIEAFSTYRHTTPSERVKLLSTITQLIEQSRTQLVAAAATESHLPETRLNNELNRTIFQLETYGAACQKDIVWKHLSIMIPWPNLQNLIFENY